jgi:hypothetical protein
MVSREELGLGRRGDAVLGRTVVLEQPCERWIVWPVHNGYSVEPHAAEFAECGIREQSRGGFAVGALGSTPNKRQICPGRTLLQGLARV